MKNISNVRNTRLLTASLVIILGAAGVSITQGCNTTKGAGQDIEELGDTIEDAADDADG